MFSSKLTTIVAFTALGVAALGSTPLGHAAARMVLPSNSVGSTQIKKNAVTGAKVKDGSLLAADFKVGQLPAGPQGAKGDNGAQGAKGDTGATGAKGDVGAQGPKGDAGIPGANGAQGQPGLANVRLVDFTSANNSNASKFLSPTCPNGQRAISVSASVSQSVGAVGYVALTQEFITGNDAAVVEADEVGGGTVSNWTLLATLVCANVQ
jgi:Flp pilus assembly protein CpaB